jgi:hypothetical protein
METINEPTTQLTIAERASSILKFDERKAQLADLAKGSARIVSITNPDGYKECHGARMALKNMRVTIEKVGKEARDDANAFSKAVIAKEKELIAVISPEEARLQKLQDAWDAEREAERAERARQERERLEAEQRALHAIRDLPLQLVGKPAAAIDLAISNLATEDFLATVPEAAREQARALAAEITPKLTALRDERLSAEAEAKRLADERAELERQRKQQESEQAERDRIASEQREREETERRAELKRQQDELAEQRKKFEEEQAELRRQQEAQRQREQEESDRKAAAERKRQDDEARDAREAEQQRERDAREAHVAKLKAGAPALRLAAADAHSLLCNLGKADHDITITLAFAIAADAEHAKKTSRRRAA